MRRHLALLGIGVALTVALVVFLAPGARAVGAALVNPAVTTDPLPLEKEWRFVVATAGTFQGTSGFVIILTGDGVFGGASGLSGGGVFSIYKGAPVAADTVSTGTWKATSFVHFQGWGGNNQRAFGGQLTMKTAVQVDDGPHFTGGTAVVTCLIGHPPAGMKEGVTVSGNGVNFNTPVTGVTLFSMPSFQVDTDLKAASPSGLVALINRQSIGACNLGCC